MVGGLSETNCCATVQDRQATKERHDEAQVSKEISVQVRVGVRQHELVDFEKPHRVAQVRLGLSD